MSNQQIIHSYNYGKYEGIEYAYQKPSLYKLRAENYILEQMNSKNGYDYKVCSHNSFMFTCGYKYNKDNKTHLVYHTPTKMYDIIIGA